MNAPLRIQIDDATKRKADCWERAQEGELSAHDAEIIDAALSHYAEYNRSEAYRLDALQRKFRLKGMTGATPIAIETTARQLHLIASRSQDLRDKFQDGGNAYIMPGDA